MYCARSISQPTYLVSPLLMSTNSQGAKSGLVAQVITPASSILLSLSPSPVIPERSSLVAPEPPVTEAVDVVPDVLDAAVLFALLLPDVVSAAPDVPDAAFDALVPDVLFILPEFPTFPEHALNTTEHTRVNTAANFIDFFISGSSL